jgi:hypothetical protein
MEPSTLEEWIEHCKIQVSLDNLIATWLERPMYVNLIVNGMLERFTMKKELDALAEIEQFNKDAEEELRRRKMPDLKLLQGGKGPPTEDHPDWLSDMPVGAIFLVQHRNQPTEFTLGLFHLVDKTEKGACVLFTKGSNIPAYVNPSRFSRLFTLYEFIDVLPMEEKKEETEEENAGSGAIQPEGLEQPNPVK